MDLDSFQREFSVEITDGLVALGLDAVAVRDEGLPESWSVKIAEFPVNQIIVAGHGFCCGVDVFCSVSDSRISGRWPIAKVRSHRVTRFFRLRDAYFETPYARPEAVAKISGGEGIYFSSQVADHLNGDSHLLALLRDERTALEIEVDSDEREWLLNFQHFFELNPGRLKRWRDFCEAVSRRLLTTPPPQRDSG